MRCLETEPPASVKPSGFDDFLDELSMVADHAGVWALIGVFWFAPEEPCRYLVAHPHLWEGLLTRARYADWKRFESGMQLGQRCV